MGRRKKRAAPNARERIFCYYCDRNFQQEQELLAHQKEKHLRCPFCTKRMLSIQSLLVHADQMHNTRVTSVPNSIPGRESVAVDVLGMTGIPDSFYASLDDPHLPKRSRNAHLSPTALPNTFPTNAYVDVRSAHAASSPAASLPPYSAPHLYSYPPQPATHAVSYSQHGTHYNYSQPTSNHPAPNYAYPYNASQPNYNAAQALYPSTSAPQPYNASLDASQYANYTQPTSYNYQSATRLPPLRAAYPTTALPSYTQSQLPTTNPIAPYTSAEPARSPSSHFNNYAPQKGINTHQYQTHAAAQQLYPSQPASDVVTPPPASAPPPVPQSKLIFESTCSPEEERAQLPRYMTKPRCASTS
ncbi:unnamed protein product [Agarophyton chilense]|eukprot:gb/GEZJ01002544.1/.p1 GENE.gb/GEZJ01002544.1/~~gb/GEZJ01002544.1/.p1  ORF type:complete len:358 (+),score=35.81 gb/GEZJ01002544.1/:257-1330(+)